MQFQINSRSESRSSRFRVLRKVFSTFTLSDAESNTSGPLNRGGIDLPLLTTLLAIHQTSWEPSFWEYSFVLVAYTSLAASRTFLQWLIACLDFTLDSDIFCWQKQKKWFLWTMAPWRSVKINLIFMMRDIYINSNLNPLTELTSSSRSTEFKDTLTWNISHDWE